VIKLTDKSKEILKKITIAFLVAISMATFSSGGRGKSYSQEDELLSQKTRNEIYQLIENNEGIHFREICRKLDKKMGVVQYHISVLEKSGLIRAVKDGRYKCFFSLKNNVNVYKPQQELTFEQKRTREGLIAAMKRDTPKSIINHLIKEGKASHQTLAEICGVSPQAITFHCQRLSNINLIQPTKIGRQKFYILPQEIQKIIKFI
jgi:predicted transcriptional regulator